MESRTRTSTRTGRTHCDSLGDASNTATEGAVMSTRVKQFLGALAQPSPLTTTGRELVPVALPETPQSLAADIRRLNTEVENALLTAVANGIEAGKALVAAKRLVGHGNFESYVTIECHISM